MSNLSLQCSECGEWREQNNPKDTDHFGSCSRRKVTTMSDTDTEFNNMISREFLNEQEPTADADVKVWGCRVLFYKSDDPTKHKSVLISWLTYDYPTAIAMRHKVARSEALMALHAMHGLTGWVPMGARIVQLAEVPF